MEFEGSLSYKPSIKNKVKRKTKVIKIERD
jgi:hypothetical protein